jgi:hypothetical protein
MGSRQRPDENCRRSGPHTPRPKLTPDIVREFPDGWEATVTDPLPLNPSYELLEMLRSNVLDFLDIKSGRSTQTEQEITETLKAGFDRLLEIALLLRQPAPEPLPGDDEFPPF